MKLSFDVGERELVATVFLQLMVTYQSGAHLEVLLRPSCTLKIAVTVDSEAFNTAKSSTWRALEMCTEGFVVLSLMKMTK